MKFALAKLFTRFNRQRTAVQVEDELRFHVEMLEHKYRQEGMPAAEAKATALRRFGNLEKIKQHCVDIRRRTSQLTLILKTALILFALTGLAISIFGSDFRVTRIGHMLIMIAVCGRLLLYVRGLGPSLGTKQSFLSVVSPEDAKNSRYPNSS